MPTVYIDGTEYEARPGTNMLEVALENGLNLPYFCWHPAMGSVGSCRLCAVKVFKDENDTQGKIQMACMTPVAEGTRMSMTDPEASEFRRYVIEWLMINHPHDCPVCDEGGECHLQDMTIMCGHNYRRYDGLKRTHNNQYLGPFVNHEMNRCIQCYRCVRFYRDLAGGRDLNVFASKNHVYFGRQEDGALQSEFSGNLVEVCPTGVFTDKTLKQHYTRKWDLETAPSVCIHCGLGCNTIPGARYGTLRRIRARFSSEVNGYFICDRGRYGYEFVNSDLRVRTPESVTASGERVAVSGEQAMTALREALALAKGVVGIGSPRASLESNYALRALVGAGSFCTGLSAFEQAAAEAALEALREGPAFTPSLAQVEDADAVLVLGADPTNEAPMLDFAIRQAMRKAPLDIARRLKIPDWDANAVANALQSAKGKLHTVTPWGIKIEEIACNALHASFGGTVGFAQEVERLLGGQGDARDDASGCAASDLRDARQPLIVTSISAGADVVMAAANLARTLCQQGKPCWLTVIVPEANTLGAAMMGGADVDEALRRLESGEADTLIVTENDLSRRIAPDRLNRALAKTATLIVIDCLRTPTADAAHVLIPSAAYVESNGTFVNNEGRAQRFYQVFIQAGDPAPAWLVLRDAGQREWETYEDVLRELASELPEFAGALEASTPSDWRDSAGRKVPRMSHRFSGRTAKDANKSVFEPRSPDDPATPFAFSMEGDHNPQPGPLVPRFWAPGWNSENAVSKFQIEIGGPLHGGPPGRRLVEPAMGQGKCFDIPARPAVADDVVEIIPRPRIFGSEELSRLTPAVAELAPTVELSVAEDIARAHELSDGDRAEIDIDGLVRVITVGVDTTLAAGTVSVPANIGEAVGIVSPARARVRRAK